MEDRIGVIVPVYKTEKYVAECIESILAQTYTNFRLILVDDGSPDNAGAICDEYAKKDSRITVIHQENAGVTRARARGVEEAHDCEWITFVDSDDTIPYKVLDEFISVINKNNKIDIIVGYRTEINNKKEAAVYNSINTGLYNSIDYINAMLRNNCIIGPWGKIIRKSVFTKEVFSISRKVVQYEDLYMNVITGYNAKYIHIDNSIHAYVHIEDSPSSQFSYNGYMKEEGWVILITTLKDFFVRNNIFDKVSECFSYFSYAGIARCNMFNNKRFRKCSKLKLKAFTKGEKRIKFANQNFFTFYLYFLVKQVKSYLSKLN